MNLVLLAENRVITSIFSFKISPLSLICLPINLWAGEILAMVRRIYLGVTHLGFFFLPFGFNDF